jgi:hypothetical protein
VDYFEQFCIIMIFFFLSSYLFISLIHKNDFLLISLQFYIASFILLNF